jgi:phage major head subunit gpT-like protein
VITPANFSLFVSAGNNTVGAVYEQDDVADVSNDFSTELPTGNLQEIYVWTGMLPKPRVWVGSRTVVESAAQTYVVPNVTYELTLEINRVKLDNDARNWGVYYRQLADMARQTKRLRAYWLRDLLQNTGFWTGKFQNGYDGLTYFNVAHPVDVYSSGAGTYCNDFAAGGQSIGGIQIGGAFGFTAIATMREYGATIPAEDGEPLGIIYNRVMIPAALELEANLVLKSMSAAPPAWATITGQVGAADNPMLRFGMQPVVNPFLDNISKTRFYTYDNTKALKPMVWQVNTPAQFAARVSPTDSNVFDRNAYVWGTWGFVAPAWSYSFLMARGGST